MAFSPFSGSAAGAEQPLRLQQRQHPAQPQQLHGFIQPLLAAEIFGRSAYNTTLGIMMAMLSVGGLLSSPLVNFSFDATGSYTRILIVLAVIAAVDALFLLPAFHAEAKYRRELEASGQLSDAGPET